MFVSHDKNVGKKTFQKPNILRRKTKVSIAKPNISNLNESLAPRSLVTSNIEEANISRQDTVIQHLGDITSANVNQTVWKLTLASCEDKDETKSQETDLDANVHSDASICTVTQSKSINENFECSLNVDSFINNAHVGEVTPSRNILIESLENRTNQAKSKWVFDLVNDPAKIVLNDYNELHSEQNMDSVIVVPSVPTLDYEQPATIQDHTAATIITPTIPLETYSSRAIKYKCDHPNCNKGFWSEERLNKHKNSHNRQTVRTASHTHTYECPIKKVIAEGIEEKCPNKFQVRSDLLKHLNEDHTLEDAHHRCEVCGRRFFWASGLRAHAASQCARGGLVCGWPGCGRVFRLPCRLREHARAHTGDRPYLCQYPDCGWAFRSASKLVRHSRRHTDERRHACTSCGRAFLRREHLRDHVARHHACAPRTAHACTHHGCEQTFTNMSTLYMHMKKVHRSAEKDNAISAPVDQELILEKETNVYLVNLENDVSAVEDSVVDKEPSCHEVERSMSPVVDGADGADGVTGGDAAHAARTHCTWPLPRHALANHYVLDDDANVEQAEGAGCDVYNDVTVRSDLFLHGNVPIDEDSQHMVGVASLASSAAPDLCLIDAHPTIDLMQEELMYEDAAVDESSFRVFLMNGEELT